MSTLDLIDICERIAIDSNDGGLLDRVINAVADENLQTALRDLEHDAASQFQDLFPLDKPAPYQPVTEERLRY
jgi:hypothetical protein